MAGSLNRVLLIGNLTADPESRSMQSGGEVVNFSVATNESWKDRDGNRQERAEYHRVVIWNEALGKVAKQYLRKGSKVYLEGQLQTRKWTDDRAGNDRSTTEVVLQRFRGELVLLDSRESGAKEAQPERYASHRPREMSDGAADYESLSGGLGGDDDSDIPF